MASRNKVEFKVTHVFKDGTVASDTSGHTVPEEITKKVLAVLDRIHERQAREEARKFHDADGICAAGQ